MGESFAALEEEFLRFTRAIVPCTATTVDARGRPRSRMLHPIFEVVDGRPVGWVVTSKTPVKAAHLAANPHMACAYWSPAQNTVFVDCLARWVEDAETRRRVFDLFQSTPPPLGYDLSGFGADGPDNPLFTPLRLDPWRIQVMRGEEFPVGNLAGRIWRAPASG
jgi:hypothetical protein